MEIVRAIKEKTTTQLFIINLKNKGTYVITY